MTHEPRRHDCPNCDPNPAISTETVRGGRRLNTPNSAARSDHPVPNPAAHAQDDEPWAAQRAADWYDRPDTRTSKAVHIGRPDGWSRCGRSFLSEDLMWDPGDVSEALRCRSNGCRQAWPTTAGGGV